MAVKSKTNATFSQIKKQQRINMLAKYSGKALRIVFDNTSSWGGVYQVNRIKTLAHPIKTLSEQLLNPACL